MLPSAGKTSLVDLVAGNAFLAVGNCLGTKLWAPSDLGYALNGTLVLEEDPGVLEVVPVRSLGNALHGIGVEGRGSSALTGNRGDR